MPVANQRRGSELEFEHGHPLAIVLLPLTAVPPYFLFKWMKRL